MTAKHHMRALAYSAALLLLASRPAAADAALDALVKEIVTVTPDGDRSAIVGRFEPAFAKAYAAASENTDELIIDFDFMTNSQDPDVAGIRKTIKATATAKSEVDATITVTFAPDTVINYLVSKDGATWRVRDVVYPKDGTSLRDLAGGK